MQVDLIDQPQLEELPADRRGEDLEVLAARRLEPDPRGLGHVAGQKGDAVAGRGGVVGMVGQDEDGPVPGAAWVVLTWG